MIDQKPHEGLEGRLLGGVVVRPDRKEDVLAVRPQGARQAEQILQPFRVERIPLHIEEEVAIDRKGHEAEAAPRLDREQFHNPLAALGAGLLEPRLTHQPLPGAAGQTWRGRGGIRRRQGGQGPDTGAFKLDDLVVADAGDQQRAIRRPPFGLATRKEGAMAALARPHRSRVMDVVRRERLEAGHEPGRDVAGLAQVEALGCSLAAHVNGAGGHGPAARLLDQPGVDVQLDQVFGLGPVRQLGVLGLIDGASRLVLAGPDEEVRVTDPAIIGEGRLVDERSAGRHGFRCQTQAFGERAVGRDGDGRAMAGLQIGEDQGFMLETLLPHQFERGIVFGRRLHAGEPEGGPVTAAEEVIQARGRENFDHGSHQWAPFATEPVGFSP